MKKVLIIGHFWPYRGGSKRIIGLAKHLSDFGWEPIIITGSLIKKSDSEFRVVEVPCTETFDFWKKILSFFKIGPEKGASRDLKSKLGIKSSHSFIDLLIRFYLSVFSYPDSFKGWRSSGFKVAKNIIKDEGISAVISVWPVTSHIIAKKIKNKYKKLTWVVDFPDLWSENCDYAFGVLRKFFDRKLEVKTLKNADALVVLSKYDRETQQKIHGTKPIYVIPHGYDLEEVNDFPIETTEKFTLTYAGTFYNKKRDPSKLFRAVKELIEEGFINIEDIEIRFYGPKEEWVSKIAEDNNISCVLKQEGITKREVVIKKERESQALLLFKWEDRREKGVYSGKIFEYLAARRPILATGGGEDVVTELLKETVAGIDAPSFRETKEALREMYSEYKNKGKVSYGGNIEKVKRYSSKEMARKFAKILNEKN